MDDDALVKGLTAGAIGFGVAGVVAPDLLVRSYGIKDPSPGLRFMTRLWGTRNLVLGSLMIALPKERATLLKFDAAMNLADSLIGFTAAGLPAQTRVMAGLTSGAFAVGSAYIAKASG